jgi:hypothetical protein
MNVTFERDGPAGVDAPIYAVGLCHRWNRRHQHRQTGNQGRKTLATCGRRYTHTPSAPALSAQMLVAPSGSFSV